MTTIQDTVNGTKTTGATGTSGTSSTASATQATEDRFLKLLVTQMKNQDPMNPLDNAQVTSQMAQLSTVTGIEKLNSSLDAMSKSFMANQSLQAATMIGHGVLVPGTDGMTLSGGAAYAGVDLQGPADSLVVSVKDKTGAVVRSLDLGAQATAGAVPFQWDGKSDAGVVQPDGQYTFDISATQGTDKVKADKLTVGQVSSVTLGAKGVSLNVAGLGAIDAANVKQIY
jgi:flagellar basal-body rod modification protein FlgD